MAKLLEIPNWKTYTGHCWRRSAATEAAANGLTTAKLKKGFNWTTEKQPLRYVDNTYKGTVDMAHLITGQHNHPGQLAALQTIGYVQNDVSFMDQAGNVGRDVLEMHEPCGSNIVSYQSNNVTMTSNEIQTKKGESGNTKNITITMGDNCTINIS